MDSWELFFREKSRRRFRPSRTRIAKAAVLALIAAEVVIVAVMLMR